MKGVLYYHPKREDDIFDGIKVYYDSFNNDNQDPYIWNDNFLHTFCHITQNSNEIGQINFWVSSDKTLRDINKLYCDLVFVIAEKHYWSNANYIERSEYFIENDNCYNEHYNCYQSHFLKKKRRYTLKADSTKSFQPQDGADNLIDVLPFLNSLGLLTESLITGMTAGFNSKPFVLKEEHTTALYDYLSSAKVKLYGSDFKKLRF